jgi:hypothetical protein
MLESVPMQPEVHEWITTSLEAILTWFTGLINDRWSRRLKRKILRARLKNDGWKWRRFESLRRAIREDDSETRALLIELGAHASTKHKDVWTLSDD